MRMYCITFSRSISDDVRDALLVTAYLMIRGGINKKKIRSKFCEGVVTTDFEPVFVFGMNGLVFRARLETEKDDLNVSYLVRYQDLAELEKAEQTAWVSPTDDWKIPAEKKRPNPIRAVAEERLNN